MTAEAGGTQLDPSNAGMEQGETLQGQHLGEKHLQLGSSASLIWNWPERNNVKPLNVISGAQLPEELEKDRQRGGCPALVYTGYLLICPTAGMSCQQLQKSGFLPPALLWDLKEIPESFQV